MIEDGLLPARPRTRMRRAARRLQLLGVARDMIAVQGVEALSMNALADCAGVAKPVVYSHFANSDQVIVALLDDYYESRRRYVRAATDRATTLVEYIDVLLDSSFAFERESPLRIQRIGNGYSSSVEVNAAFARYNGHIRGYWQALLEQQGVPGAAAGVAAFALTTMVTEATAHFAARFGTSPAARETLKQMILATISALSTSPTSARPDVHVTSYRQPAPDDPRG